MKIWGRQMVTWIEMTTPQSRWIETETGAWQSRTRSLTIFVYMYSWRSKIFWERYIIDLVFFILNFQLYVMVKLLMATSHHQEVGLYQ